MADIDATDVHYITTNLESMRKFVSVYVGVNRQIKAAVPSDQWEALSANRADKARAHAVIQ